MSKERELLTRLVKSGVLGGYSFIAEVKDLLAQPEQTEQEPVAWMYDSYEDGRRDRYDCLTTTEDYVTNYGVSNIRPLYTAPPKREPLSDERLRDISNREFYQAGYAEAELKLKRETLSDKEIGQAFLQIDAWHRYECFIAGVRFAEKEHGIGGGE